MINRLITEIILAAKQVNDQKLANVFVHFSGHVNCLDVTADPTSKRYVKGEKTRKLFEYRVNLDRDDYGQSPAQQLQIVLDHIRKLDGREPEIITYRAKVKAVQEIEITFDDDSHTGLEYQALDHAAEELGIDRHDKNIKVEVVGHVEAVKKEEPADV